MHCLDVGAILNFKYPLVHLVHQVHHKQSQLILQQIFYFKLRKVSKSPFLHRNLTDGVNCVTKCKTKSRVYRADLNMLSKLASTQSSKDNPIKEILYEKD